MNHLPAGRQDIFVHWQHIPSRASSHTHRIRRLFHRHRWWAQRHLRQWAQRLRRRVRRTRRTIRRYDKLWYNHRHWYRPLWWYMRECRRCWWKGCCFRPGVRPRHLPDPWSGRHNCLQSYSRRARRCRTRMMTRRERMSMFLGARGKPFVRRNCLLSLSFAWTRPFNKHNQDSYVGLST